MAEEAKMTVVKKSARKPDNKLKITLIAAAGVLVAGLAAAAVLLLGSTAAVSIERVIEFNTVVQGVSVNGVDISGMTAQQAREATQSIDEQIIGGTQLRFDVGGNIVSLDAHAIGLVTDYDAVIEKAIAYGRTGGFAQRQTDLAAAKNGVDFPVSIAANEAGVRAALEALAETLNVAPRDASYKFMKNGYFADGTEYDPAVYDAVALGEPKLVMLDEADRPGKFRYEYWNNSKYVEGYVPKNAYISRFLYIPEERGLETDIDALTALVMQAVDGGDLSAVITAPTTVTEPTVTLEQVKKQTQLVASWTSSYSNHNNANRIKNVTKMLGIVNGTVLQPGVVWSVNDTAGPRKVSLGWWEAAGINGGAYVSDPGGGVCQVSSTIYNAAIRSGVEVTDKTHHSIISDYIPIGLDATISTGSPDLKLRNNYDVPMFIVTYINTEEQNVTVEVYGPTVVDATFGDVILTYTSKRGGTGEVPGNEMYYNMATAPDGTPIAPGASYEYRKARGATSAVSYLHILDLTGKELTSREYEKCTYRAYTGQIYCNYPDPATVVPDPGIGLPVTP